jgi:tRNA(fMet)-specific endonuclease VapC
MSLFILDTDILSLYWEGNEPVRSRVDAHGPGGVAITVISAEEQVSGWYTLVRQAKQNNDLARAYQRLADCIAFLAGWRILSFTEPAITRYDQLKAMKFNVAKMDLRIAAIVLENGGTLVTRNLRDFQRVPGLSLENWAV